ncbi:MAG TPA: hypothetical protein VK797_03270 [Tepidisphaeraceae bacterium]|jgi:hypothetical protein|nr:hypothetical protein [Tepidisphaeraceae bacterium]
MASSITKPESTEIPQCDRGRKILLQLVRTVDATGGVVRHEDGCYSPVADPEWIDLGDAYAEACAFLGHEIVLAEHRFECDQPVSDTDSR